MTGGDLIFRTKPSIYTSFRLVLDSVFSLIPKIKWCRNSASYSVWC